MKIQTLNLYSTSHCHLCEQAVQVLKSLPLIYVTIIDIADDMQLMEFYGLRIPVLQRNDSKAELNWPFNADDVVLFLSDQTH